MLHGPENKKVHPEQKYPHKTEEKKYGKHPTQKPADLLKRIILASTNKGDTVLDPFSGSSTTGLVAYFYDRDFIGIDTSQEYLDLSIKRFEDMNTKTNTNPQLIEV